MELKPKYIVPALVVAATGLMSSVQTARAQEGMLLEEIIVTAQRREESVQKVPIAVAVVTGQALENRNGVSLVDVASMTPSVVFSQGFIAKNSSIRIRGIGTDSSSIGVEPSVSTVVDNVVMQRAGQSFTDLGDVQRIEVLRGPQGTLFGKNSAAGVVNIVTNEPTFNKTESSYGLLATDDNEYRVNGMFSTPISDNVAIRAVGFYRNFDGNVKNVRNGEWLNGIDAFGGRVKMTVKAGEALTFKLSADYIKSDSDCCAAPPRDFAPTPAPLTLPPFSFTPGPNNDKVDNDVNSFANSKSYGGSAQIDYETAGPTLTWISARRRYGIETQFDFDNTGAKFYPTSFNYEPNDTTTHEFRVTSQGGGRLDYVAGALYIDSDVSNIVEIRGLNKGGVAAVNPITGDITPVTPNDPLGCNCGPSRVTGTNLGLYGQLDLHATEKLTLTAGARYIDEKQRFRFDRPNDTRFNGIAAAVTTPALKNVQKSYSDNEVIYKAAAAFQFTNDIMAYAAYSTGYTGQAANTGITLSQFEFDNAVPIRPMTSKLAEVGLKTRLFGTLQLNTAVFRTRFEDYQSTTIRQDNGLLTLANIGSVAIDGIELELAAKPLAGLSINGGVTFLDARYLQATNSCAPANIVPSGSPDCSLINGRRVLVLDGKEFSNAPDVRYTLNTRYEHAIGSLVGYVQADYRWQSEVRLDTNRNPYLIQKAYGIGDLAFGVNINGGRYNVELFVKNVGDTQYVNQIRTFNNNVISAPGTGVFTASELPRDFNRYFGASLKAKF